MPLFPAVFFVVELGEGDKRKTLLVVDDQELKAIPKRKRTVISPEPHRSRDEAQEFLAGYAGLLGLENPGKSPRRPPKDEDEEHAISIVLARPWAGYWKPDEFGESIARQYERGGALTGAQWRCVVQLAVRYLQGPPWPGHRK